MEITDKHRKLLADLEPAKIPWRRLTIAVDGGDGAGKSTLARFLSWQLGMPAIETDLFLRAHAHEPSYDLKALAKVVEARHGLNRPVIIAGMCVLETLRRIGIEPEYRVYVEMPGHPGSDRWQARFRQYRREYRPKDQAMLFRRRPSICHAEQGAAPDRGHAGVRPRSTASRRGRGR
jgi:uridine kinase